MYMAGRRRTASIPSRTLMSSAVYSPLLPLPAAFFALVFSFAVATAAASFVAKSDPIRPLKFQTEFELPRMLAAEFPVNFKLLILQSLRGELSTTDYSMNLLWKVARKRLILGAFAIIQNAEVKYLGEAKMMSLKGILWLTVLLLLQVPPLIVRARMSREVNVHTVDGGEQFHGGEWWKWNFAKHKRLWQKHRRYYPDSKLRTCFIACYVPVLLWFFGAGAFL